MVKDRAQTVFVIDGVDSNSGITPGGQNPGASVAGGAPALTATGGSSSVVAFDAAQEIKIQNSNFSAQYGRNTGGQVSVTTKAEQIIFTARPFTISAISRWMRTTGSLTAVRSIGPDIVWRISVAPSEVQSRKIDGSSFRLTKV
jgi:hypothetical protein